MKERPILFSGPMVRAILDGRKTQTRRIVYKLSEIGNVTEFARSEVPGWDYTFRDKRMRWNDLSASQLLKRCPHGKIGDYLWVRETFSAWYHACHWYDCTKEERSKASCSNCFYRETHHLPDDDQKWVPSIFMPRWASRITLEVTNVRVERLQDISHRDAMQEGLIEWTDPPRVQSLHYGLSRSDCWEITPQKAFERLWLSINGPESWSANPWVWVVEFKRVKP